jgi:hypothetical protein
MLPYAPMRRRPTSSGRGAAAGRRTLVEAAAVCALAIFAAILFTYPLAFALDRAGRFSDDGKLSVWNVGWVARTLIVDPLRIYDANIFYPHHGTLAYSESNLGAGVLAMPAYWITRNAIAAHNTAVLAAFALSAIAMYLLAKHLTADRAAAVTAAILFAYCPYVFSKFAHVQLLMTAGLPAALLAFHRVAESPRLASALRLALVLAVQGLACAYYGIFAAMMMGYAAIFFAVSRGLWRDRAYLVAVAAAGVTAVALILPFFIPYAQVQESGAFGRSLDEARTYSADWRSYLTSSAVFHRWIESVVAEGSEVLFPGFVAAAAGLGGVWVGIRAADARTRETTAFYAVLGGLAFWASFGPSAGLYTVFFRVIPVFSLLRAPARFGIILVLALAVLAALLVAHLRERRGWAGVAVALVAAIELLEAPVNFRDAPVFPPVYRTLATLPRGAVAEFPFYADRSNYPRHAHYMLFSTMHWQPLINGYSDYIPDDFRDAAPVLSTFPSPAAFEALHRLRARYVVMHFDLMDHRSVPGIQASLQNEFGPYLRLLARENDVWLFQIVGWPR